MKRCLEVLPGSLDHLYYNDILPAIPYEAYEAPVYGQMNGSQYLNYAKSGLGYDAYTHPDTFVYVSNQPYEKGEGFSLRNSAIGINNYGYGNDFEELALGKDGKKARKTFSKTVNKTWEYYQNTPDWFRGIIGGCAIVATSCLLIRRGIKSNIFSKLNPINWFKK